MPDLPVQLPCPGCGFLTYGPAAYGSYALCPLCFWEDCPLQLANPLDTCGPNHESLVVYQERSLRRWPLAARTVEHKGHTYTRDPRWRPLSASEIAYFRLKTEDGTIFAFDSITKLEDCYWMMSKLPEPAPPRRVVYEKLRVIGPAFIDGRYYRVIDFATAGGGHGLLSQVWVRGQWMNTVGEGPGCPRIMAAPPASHIELDRVGVDHLPLEEDYDPFAVEIDVEG